MVNRCNRANTKSCRNLHSSVRTLLGKMCSDIPRHLPQSYTVVAVTAREIRRNCGILSVIWQAKTCRILPQPFRSKRLYIFSFVSFFIPRLSPPDCQRYRKNWGNADILFGFASEGQSRKFQHFPTVAAGSVLSAPRSIPLSFSLLLYRFVAT